MADGGDREGYECVGQAVCENSVRSAQFFCELKTALKKIDSF